MTTTPTMPALMPMIQVHDLQGTLDWFNKLGFTTDTVLNMPDGSIGHAEVVRGPVRLMLGGAWGEVGSPGLGLYITLTESVDAYCKQVTDAGVTLNDELKDEFWGDRVFSVKHPDGYQITFGQHVRDVSEEELKAAMAKMADMAPATA